MKRLWKLIAEICNSRVADIISALVYTGVRGHPARSPHGSANHVVVFVTAQLSRMPDILRLPLRILTILFDLSGLAVFLRVFRRQSIGQRTTQMALWRHAVFAPFRDLMRFYDSLTTLSWLDGETVHAIRPTETPTGAPAFISR